MGANDPSHRKSRGRRSAPGAGRSPARCGGARRAPGCGPRAPRPGWRTPPPTRATGTKIRSRPPSVRSSAARPRRSPEGAREHLVQRREQKGEEERPADRPREGQRHEHQRIAEQARGDEGEDLRVEASVGSIHAASSPGRRPGAGSRATRPYYRRRGPAGRCPADGSRRMGVPLSGASGWRAARGRLAVTSARTRSPHSSLERRRTLR